MDAYTSIGDAGLRPDSCPACGETPYPDRAACKQCGYEGLPSARSRVDTFFARPVVFWGTLVILAAIPVVATLVYALSL
ncbi:hypothetical protein DU478_16270 [Thalassococcus profundi]|uniref:Uncharacterized protein n=1 Tax=Thalassococcus profundi TaxID=2282382 RepID=A0A369TK38_9RHOB|nr:hypothetical protein [Thalassococcus profundi]RDD65212.1 hypothetical protein DU478_16270 [Thalassococcus profundi]